MPILYTLTFLILFLSLLLLKRNNKKSNILISIVYISVILYFYNILISLVLTTFEIKNTLFLYSLIYLLTTSIIFLINYKKYNTIKFQEFNVNKKELIGFILIFAICLSLGFIRTNGFAEPNYIVNDGATHYKMSKDYSIYQKLLYTKDYKDDIYGFGHTMPGYYVDCGIFMQIMPMKTYTSYNLFNTLTLCLLALAFYVTCLKIKKTNKNNIFTIIITLLYTLGYPLNYFLYGFGYLGTGILACNLILLTWYLFDDKYDKGKSLYISLGLFNFGLFFSYYLFVPVIFLAEALYMIFIFMTKKYTFKQLLKYGIISLLIPTIVGALFFLFGNSSQAGLQVLTKGYQINGYSYTNFWGNFVLFIPLIIYSFINEIKSSKIHLEIFALVILCTFLTFTLYLALVHKISPYYYYKPYFILWLLSFIFIFKFVNEKNEKINLLIKISIGFIIVVILISAFNFERKIQEKNAGITYTAVANELANVYNYNLKQYSEKDSIKKDELKLINAAIKNKEKCNIKNSSSEMPVKGLVLSKSWFYAISNIVPYYSHEKGDVKIFVRSIFEYEKIKEDKEIKCIVIINRHNKKNDHTRIETKNDYSVLYENKAGKLLIKK